VVQTLVGALGHRHRALVDERGRVAPTDATWELGWWIGAEDRWHVPEREASVRQTLIDGTPVVQTAMRVPSGDALHRVYGVAGDGDPIVVEVENASPAPFVVALVASGASAITLDGAEVFLDGRSAVVSPRPPSRWSCGVGGVELEVMSGGAQTGAFRPMRDRGARIEAAFLHPVPHRATVRLVLSGRRAGAPIDLATIPDADSVARGWQRQIDRGTRFEVADESLMTAVRCALGAALLSTAEPRAVAALEDWGFDDEATAGWAMLTWRQRRAAARRSPHQMSWSDVTAARAEGGAPFLLALRSLLVYDADGATSILAELPNEWRGGPIDLRGAPTRHGPVSFSVRWHGERAALLWEVPTGVALRAPGLDPEWSTTEPTGEALLG